MGELLLSTLPFAVLLAAFVYFSVYMLRAMGSGKEGSYTSLMKRQVDLFEAQIETQKEVLTEIRRQSDALERIAETLTRDR